MTRHAKNCTAGPVYTYHEKKKDAASSGYGTNKQRVGKDSVKDFDCCSLSLQPCRNPVITQDGYLFDKEAILQYIITKKNEHSRQLKEYQRQKKLEEEEQTEAIEEERNKKLCHFIQKENNIISKPLHSLKPLSNLSTMPSISNMTEGRDKQLPSFWLASKTPESKPESKIKKPVNTIFCPVSGNPLKAKDLIDVKFTVIKDPYDKKALIIKQNRYMCAVTHDILSNSIPCAILKPTGNVVTMECVEKLIKKDMIHPLNGQKLSESDIIPLQRGGTGYSITNEKLEGQHRRPALQVIENSKFF